MGRGSGSSKQNPQCHKHELAQHKGQQAARHKAMLQVALTMAEAARRTGLPPAPTPLSPWGRGQQQRRPLKRLGKAHPGSCSSTNGAPTDSAARHHCQGAGGDIYRALRPGNPPPLRPTTAWGWAQSTVLPWEPAVHTHTLPGSPGSLGQGLAPEKPSQPRSTHPRAPAPARAPANPPQQRVERVTVQRASSPSCLALPEITSSGSRAACAMGTARAEPGATHAEHSRHAGACRDRGAGAEPSLKMAAWRRGCSQEQPACVAPVLGRGMALASTLPLDQEQPCTAQPHGTVSHRGPASSTHTRVSARTSKKLVRGTSQGEGGPSLGHSPTTEGKRKRPLKKTQTARGRKREVDGSRAGGGTAESQHGQGRAQHLSQSMLMRGTNPRAAEHSSAGARRTPLLLFRHWPGVFIPRHDWHPVPTWMRSDCSC